MTRQIKLFLLIALFASLSVPAHAAFDSPDTTAHGKNMTKQSGFQGSAGIISQFPRKFE